MLSVPHNNLLDPNNVMFAISANLKHSFLLTFAPKIMTCVMAILVPTYRNSNGIGISVMLGLNFDQAIF